MDEMKKRPTLFGGQVATEVEQAYVRVGLYFIASCFFVWANNKYLPNNNQLLLYLYIICVNLVGLGTLFIVIKYPHNRLALRRFHLVFDGTAAMLSYLILGVYASPIFFTYLFVAIGYGMRYSLSYLVVGLFVGLLLHTIGVLFSDYNPAWPELWKDYILIIVLPVYTGLLIKRLNASYTETENALKKAEAASRAKTMFLANISHDLRTPLVGVGTAVELLKTYDWSDENRELLKTIRASSEVLEQQINQILEFAKSESGGVKVKDEPIALDNLFEDCKIILMPQAAKKNIEFVFNWDTPKCIESSDSALRKIILNLVGNAIKFTEKGSVKVNVSCRNSSLHLLISDTGIGIAGDKIKTVFDPFTQADGTITRKYGGTGLGMAITRQLVDDLGGAIHLESEPGAGTHVSVIVPISLLENEQCRQTVKLDKSTLAANRSARLLVADDNATNRHIIELVLKKGGFHNYDIVSDGLQALNRMLDVDYDLVILDRHMPEMDGGSVLREYKIRNERPVKSIFLTADQTDEATQESESVGFDAFMKKPFKPDDLLDVVNGLLAST